MGTILIYYKYTQIADPEKIRLWQRELCDRLQLTGRILIAKEGINGTVGGSEQACQEYKQAMLAHPLFSDVDFKESVGGPESFPRMRIVVRNYIVNGGPEFGQADMSKAGVHLEPHQVHELLQKNPEGLVLLDARNKYESRIGTFNGAITPDINNFRELPAYFDANLEQFKDKQVLMFCTAGVRCEQASAYLRAKDIAQEVYQLKGGIQRYVEQYPDGFFRGKNYVFDGRGAISITHDVLTVCDVCATSCDDYTNCVNAFCNKLFISCTSCREKLGNACSINCQQLVESGQVVVRKFSGSSFDTKFLTEFHSGRAASNNSIKKP
jgi:predicted sulfurtransferase